MAELNRVEAGLLEVGAAVGEPVTWTLELSGTGNWPEIAGLPSRDAKFYEHEIRRHDALMVSVTILRHQTVSIQNILERHHATSVTLPA